MRGNLWNYGTISVQIRHPEFISGSLEIWMLNRIQHDMCVGEARHSERSEESPEMWYLKIKNALNKILLDERKNLL